MAPLCAGIIGLFSSTGLAVTASLLLALAMPGAATAHGVGYRISSKRAVTLEFYYSTGETMAYLEAKAYSPADEKNAFQSGRTDEFGRVSFVPDFEGEWRVVVKDEEGHMADAVVPVTSEFLSGVSENGVSAAVQSGFPQGVDLVLRALLGVSALFNIAVLARLRKCI
jgi:nickel transport protein